MVNTINILAVAKDTIKPFKDHPMACAIMHGCLVHNLKKNGINSEQLLGSLAFNGDYLFKCDLSYDDIKEIMDNTNQRQDLDLHSWVVVENRIYDISLLLTVKSNYFPENRGKSKIKSKFKNLHNIISGDYLTLASKGLKYEPSYQLLPVESDNLYRSAAPLFLGLI